MGLTSSTLTSGPALLLGQEACFVGHWTTLNQWPPQRSLLQRLFQEAVFFGGHLGEDRARKSQSSRKSERAREEIAKRTIKALISRIYRLSITIIHDFHASTFFSLRALETKKNKLPRSKLRGIFRSYQKVS